MKATNFYRKMLDNTPIELFRASFPEALDRLELAEGDSYELAKAFIYLNHDLTLLRHVGIEKLFNLLQDERTLRFSKSKYNFGLPELYALTKDADITNSRLQTELAHSQLQLHQTQVELAQSQSSLREYADKIRAMELEGIWMLKLLRSLLNKIIGGLFR
ncbi:MAG: hypothetical protein HC778_03240 [Chamaesiphon sp. CSU_1_12]|nr:hypothetical protein [Chamaesiphon sp. CSU_1_12]